MRRVLFVPVEEPIAARQKRQERPNFRGGILGPKINRIRFYNQVLTTIDILMREPERTPQLFCQPGGMRGPL